MTSDLRTQCQYSSRRRRTIKLSHLFSTLPRLATAVCLIFIATAPVLQAGSTTAAEIKKATVNGIDLTYQQQGEGTPVVFVPGALSDYRVWDAEREAVAS